MFIILLFVSIPHLVLCERVVCVSFSTFCKLYNAVIHNKCSGTVTHHLGSCTLTLWISVMAFVMKIAMAESNPNMGIQVNTTHMLLCLLPQHFGESIRCQ